MYKRYLDDVNISPFYAGAGAEPDESVNNFLRDFELLPKSLQDFLLSAETSNTIASLSEHYDLGLIETELTAWVIRNVVTGDIYIKNLPGLLSSIAGIETGKSNQLANQIVSRVLAPVVEDIKQIQKQRFPDRIKQRSPQSTQMPLAAANLNASTERSILGEDLPETGGNIIDLRQK